jgi:hypothetical protein
MTLPAGDFVVYAQAQFANTSTIAGGTLTCTISAPSVPAADVGSQSFPASGSASMTLVTPIVLASPGAVSAACLNAGGTGTPAIRLLATQVGTLSSR